MEGSLGRFGDQRLEKGGLAGSAGLCGPIGHQRAPGGWQSRWRDALYPVLA